MAFKANRASRSLHSLRVCEVFNYAAMALCSRATFYVGPTRANARELIFRNVALSEH